MNPEIEIWRAANQLVKQHGEDAPYEAARLTDAMLEKGGLEGQRVCKRVPKTVDELLATEPKGGVH